MAKLRRILVPAIIWLAIAACGEPTPISFIGHVEDVLQVHSSPVQIEYQLNYAAEDPEGHHWTFGQHVRDVAPEDMS